MLIFTCYDSCTETCDISTVSDASAEPLAFLCQESHHMQFVQARPGTTPFCFSSSRLAGSSRLEPGLISEIFSFYSSSLSGSASDDVRIQIHK